MVSRERRLRRGWVALAAAAIVVCAEGGGVGAAWGAPLFALAERSEIVARGIVERVEGHRDGTLQAFTIRPERVLKGDVAAGKPIVLVQELVFASERPYFRPAESVLVFAVPLPNYSSYRKALPAGSHWRWTERKDTAADVAALADVALDEALTRYLAVRTEPRALAVYLAELLAAENVRLRADALTALEGRRELAPRLDAEALAPLSAWLEDGHVPAAERSQVLVRLARLRAAGVGPLAVKALDGEPGLQAAALEALITIDQPPPAARLLALSHSGDTAVRVAAVRGLARIDTPAAVERVGDIVRGDASNEVRVAAIEALAGRQDDRAVQLLAVALRHQDRSCVNAAASALARTGNGAAIAALGDALAHGSFETQTAAAFALKQSGKDEAAAILRSQFDTHPDPGVRKVIGLALGHVPDEHE